MVDFKNIPYIPILTTRPAELTALRELPTSDKKKLMPAIQLRPWLTSKEFDNTIAKIDEAYGNNREWISNLDEYYEEPLPNPEQPSKDTRPAITTFKSLLEPANGYENWCAFVEKHPNMIPCVQLSAIEQLEEQLKKLLNLNRGVVFHLDGKHKEKLQEYKNNFDIIFEILKKNQAASNILFIIDFKTITNTQDILILFGYWNDLITKILKNSYSIAISGTSFPSSFTDAPLSLAIKERKIYELINNDNNGNIIYSDRGSTRINEKRQQGGSKPIPRIDYPVKNDWHFFRENKETNYNTLAKQAIESSNWDNKLFLWGTELIKATASSNKLLDIISSPVKATAVRINIHLHMQLFYNDDDSNAYLETDDDWED